MQYLLAVGVDLPPPLGYPLELLSLPKLFKLLLDIVRCSALLSALPFALALAPLLVPLLPPLPAAPGRLLGDGLPCLKPQPNEVKSIPRNMK